MHKDEKGFVNDELKLKLDLLDDYKFPACMPADVSNKIHIVADQAYVMVATPDTGTPLHIGKNLTLFFDE